MCLKTSKGKKVAYSLTCVFMLCMCFLCFLCVKQRKHHFYAHKTSNNNNKKIACLTFCAFYAFYADRLFSFCAFCAFYAVVCVCFRKKDKTTLVPSFILLFKLNTWFMCGIARSLLQTSNLVVMDVLCHRFCLHKRYSGDNADQKQSQYRILGA